MMAHIQRKMQKRINCNFISGRVEEMERIWSKAEHAVNGKGVSMEPVMFAAPLFLKVNRHFWNTDDFVVDCSVARYTRRNVISIAFNSS